MTIAIDLEEWKEASFETHPQLAHVHLPQDAATLRLIEVLTQRRRALAIPLKINQLHQGLKLEATSCVGRVALGDFQVTIRPKIAMFPLLRLMRYAYMLNDTDLFSLSQFDVEAFAFQDLLICQFVVEVSHIIACGLSRQYVRREEMLSSPRGRIAISAIARQGGILSAELPCTHHERSDDHLLNQVLLQGMHLAVQLTRHKQLNMKLQHLEHAHFQGVSSIKLDSQTLGRARRTITRLTEVYRPAIRLIEILYSSQGLSLDGEQPDLRLPGFLFDMNIFFQELLEQFLKEHLPGYQVQAQHNLDPIMSYVDNPRKRSGPDLKPDYIIKQKGRVVAILDAKYRDLWVEKLPSEMLYQLVMYAIGQDACNSATILYPTTDPGATEAKIKIHVPAHRQGNVFVMLRPVDLQRLDELVTNRHKKKNERERRRFARWLVFGNQQPFNP